MQWDEWADGPYHRVCPFLVCLLFTEVIRLCYIALSVDDRQVNGPKVFGYKVSSLHELLNDKQIETTPFDYS